ncbi:tRNA (adenosine(37)-N6)-threonylcarbamoyltransferase complex ATPase subunit type 1 TsaE [Porphyromonas circumdentaria]|uniref:tRNA (adenosine(37)-N6)-threonylcarbamoyltransferase complex ATPase subunit type 1 TsaE n=1 Tax=Porphyromonas circumdentaria TaxID=29524 RepID=UPI0026DBABC0|nr:tRNA (adenosine(37)-N6)-threonylcarbamoyltransferase complex ATPase subunit type 1 TsaE [Porphyromonas circumdentaria]MDO4721642.1 tRNA (adenosine(37)-N6)-threonylcarbamoyltransferase complex ATPase subunit type 1 TsaE [Porphyromonas circumdentaria]
MNPIIIETLAAIPQAVQAFLEQTEGHKVFAFVAPMGTGKTTFITALCRALGVDDVINSPTFAIVNEYALPHTEKVVYHMDCYRFERLEDALNLGFSDYLDSGNYCFIEWPEVIEPILPEDTLYVVMEEIEGGKRSITLLDKREYNTSEDDGVS